MSILKRLLSDNTYAILKAMRAHGGEARFVGGCVRDALLGNDSKDIDFAVNLPPELVREGCEKAGLHVADKNGIRFGTVVVVINKVNYEITSLRRDLVCDGRHAEVSYTDDWKEDAKRRDFTFNALYVDESGKLYDFFNGVNDLKEGRIRFIGNPDQRIEEDYLRMLRLLRFYIRFAAHPPELIITEACKRHAHKIEYLSGERIWQEMNMLFDIKASLTPALRIMYETGMTPYVFPGIILEKVEDAVRLLDALRSDNALSRIAFFIHLTSSRAALKRWRVSGKVSSYVNAVSKMLAVPRDEFVTMNKKFASVYGRDLYNDGIIMLRAIHNNDNLPLLGDGDVVPDFPLSGKDIVDFGFTGADIGRIRSLLYEKWLDSNCGLSRDALADFLRSER